MLTAQQQVLVQAIEELDLAQVQRLLADRVLILTLWMPKGAL